MAGIFTIAPVNSLRFVRSDGLLENFDNTLYQDKINVGMSKVPYCQKLKINDTVTIQIKTDYTTITAYLYNVTTNARTTLTATLKTTYASFSFYEIPITVTVAGFYKVIITGSYPNFITSLTNGDYDTFTSNNFNITSAINVAGSGYGFSNDFAVVNGGKYYFNYNLDLNSGEAPIVNLDSTGIKSNQVTLANGSGTAELISTYTGNVHIIISNTAASNFSLIYEKKADIAMSSEMIQVADSWDGVKIDYYNDASTAYVDYTTSLRHLMRAFGNVHFSDVGGKEEFYNNFGTEERWYSENEDVYELICEKIPYYLCQQIIFAFKLDHFIVNDCEYIVKEHSIDPLQGSHLFNLTLKMNKKEVIGINEDYETPEVINIPVTVKGGEAFTIDGPTYATIVEGTNILTWLASLTLDGDLGADLLKNGVIIESINLGAFQSGLGGSGTIYLSNYSHALQSDNLTAELFEL